MIFKHPYVIAEIGCNHKGDFSLAKEMVEIAAKYCKADAVKFQKRCIRELLSPEKYKAPHPNPDNSYGETYGSHREYLEFTVEQHAELKKHCEKFKIDYITSVWDLTSANEIASLHPKFIKIPSAVNNNYDLLSWLCSHFEGELQISLGMTTLEEENELIYFLKEQRRNMDVTIMACTSGYPVPDDDVCLLEISRLIEQWSDQVKCIGFSSHHTGIALDIAAYTLGANIIERHFTLDKTWKGTDHIASLEPNGLRRTKRNLVSVEKALRYKYADILPIEKEQRRKLKEFKSSALSAQQIP